MGGSPARAWILAFKYGSRPDLATFLGAALWQRLRLEIEAGCPARRHVLVPVPLHRWRRLERGYDQAALLARAVEQAGGPRALSALCRTRATAPQGGPGSRSRRANVRGAFALRSAALLGTLAATREELSGAHAWLVDDVVASGSTADECARVLRRAGAGAVGVLAVARGSADPGV